jgi:hypothetical protein
MTRKKQPPKKKSLDRRIATLETQIAELGTRLERLELADMERIGDEQIASGLAIPARQALESLRRKLNIPQPRPGQRRKSSFHELTPDEAKHFDFKGIST